MRKILLIAYLLACYSITFAQVGVNATGAAPLSSAQLDVASTSKAFYPPRMTTSEKNGIVGKQAGAVVYDTNLGALSFYNGSTWVSTAPTVSGATYSVNQNAQGGKIFWVDETGQHGLVVSTADQSGSTVWFNGFTNTKAIRKGAYGGAFNTDQIIQSFGYGSHAASLCAQYVSQGYGDWYLPAIEELALMRNSGISPMPSGNYWSSTENIVGTGLISENAFSFDFTSGATNITANKGSLYKVRAIRKF